MPDRRDSPGHYFSGHSYAAQAMWRVGGERWKKWYPAICDDLTLPGQHRQREDGSWMDAIGPHYATATACIILQTPLSPPSKTPTK